MSKRGKIALLLCCSLGSGFLIGAFSGIALYFFDPDNLEAVLPVSRGDIALVKWATWIVHLPVFFVPIIFVPHQNLIADVYGEKIRNANGSLFFFGWIFGLAPFFYVFRVLP